MIEPAAHRRGAMLGIGERQEIGLKQPHDMRHAATMSATASVSHGPGVTSARRALRSNSRNSA
jgi:hypothetical protein